MAEHYNQICAKHGRKRREVYDDHYIWLCDGCERDYERQEYKRSRRTRKLQQLVDRMKIRVLRGEESLREIEMILERVSQQGYYPQILQAIRGRN